MEEKKKRERSAVFLFHDREQYHLRDSKNARNLTEKGLCKHTEQNPRKISNTVKIRTVLAYGVGTVPVKGTKTTAGGTLSVGIGTGVSDIKPHVTVANYGKVQLIIIYILVVIAFWPQTGRRRVERQGVDLTVVGGRDMGEWWRRGMPDCWGGRAAGEEEISREGVELQCGARRGRKQGAAEAE